MPRTPQDVTDAELAILKVLWDRNQATVRELVAELYPTATSSDSATVQKLLRRLEAKGCIARDRAEWPHLFRASIQRDELIERRLQMTADKLCAGSLSPLITNLVSSRKLSGKERQQLRDLLDQLE